MNLTFQTPPAGMEQQVYDYLYTLSRDLNMALANIDSTNFVVGSKAAAIVSGESEEKVKAAQQEQAATLKSLIVKTAKIVQSNIDMLETRLNSYYDAQSDLGRYTEEIAQTLQALNGQVNQLIEYRAIIEDATNTISQDLNSYIIEAQGYIRSGIIGYENAIPVIGIAIGRDLQVTGETATVDGKTYDIIDKSSSMSIWTPGRLGFWVNGIEVGWFSGKALHCNTIEVGDWQITTANGFAIKWIGA